MLLSPSDLIYTQLVALHLSNPMLSLRNKDVVSQDHLEFITHMLLTVP